MTQLDFEKSATDIHFQYPIRDDELLVELEQLAPLEFDADVSELERAKSIVGYAHSLFTHDGDNTPSSGDPVTILKEARAGQSFRCVEYSTLAAGLLWANGIPARTVGLKTADVEAREYGAGHVVIEFWSKDINSWIMSDVQAGLIPEIEGVPVSAYDLKLRLDEGKSVEYVPVTDSKYAPEAPYGGFSNYSDWIHEYLYFIDTPTSLTLGNEDKPSQQIVMLVPEGASYPIMFQGMFKMNAMYTTHPQAFYAKPVLARS